MYQNLAYSWTNQTYKVEKINSDMANHIITFFGSVGAGTVKRKDLSFFCIVLLGYYIIGFSQKEWVLNKNLL